MIELNSKPKSIVGNGQVRESPSPCSPNKTSLFGEQGDGPWTIDFGLEFNSIIKNHFGLINSTILK